MCQISGGEGYNGGPDKSGTSKGWILHWANMRCGLSVFQRTYRINAENSLPQSN
jgi:hypothetical protein